MIESLQGRPIEIGLLTLAAVYVATWIHEGGHALAGRLAGFRITSLGLGFGRPLLRFRLGDTVLYLSLAKPFQGITTSVRDSWPTSRRAKAVLLSGGMAANALAGAVSWAVSEFSGSRIVALDLFALVNAAFVALGLLPATILLTGAAVKTDAAQILGLFLEKRGGAPGSRFAGLRDAERLVAFLSSIEDHFGQFHYRIHLASAVNDAGNPGRALEILAPVRESLYPEKSPMGALLRVVRGTAELAAGDEKRGSDDLARSAEFFRETGAPDMAPHIALLKARKALETGRIEEARALLDALGEGDESAASGLLRAEILLQSGDAAGALETLDATEGLSGEDLLRAETLSGLAAESSGKPGDAAETLGRAFDRALRNLRSLGHPSDREAYAGKHARLLDRYPAILEAQGLWSQSRAARARLENALSASPAPAGFASLAGISSTASAALSAAFLTVAVVKLADFRDDAALYVRWSGILAISGMFFAVSGLAQKRISRILPITGGVASGICLLVIASLSGTVYITRRAIAKETLEIDINQDGVVDRIIEYKSGQISKLIQDRDLNGEFDLWADYENGRIRRIRQDLNGDGIPDVSRPVVHEDEDKKAK